MGRPSKYDPDFPDRLIALMGMGLSFEACCGELGISKDTGYEYVKKYEDFAEAKAIGEAKGQYFWEKIARDCLVMPGGKDADKFNAAVYIFTMKNRFNWKEKKEVSGNLALGGDVGKLYKDWSNEQVEKKIEELVKRLSPGTIA